MTEAQAAKIPYNPFDLSKVWYKKDFPLTEVGMMELYRKPEIFFADVDQAAINFINIVPGIGFSPDKMLQGRLFSYCDASQGVIVRHISNCPKADPAHGKGVAKALGFTLSEVN